MKAIRKVSSIPISSSGGNIINSFNTTDDKTKNAPSINAVENYITNKVENDITHISKNDIITIYGTIEMPEAGSDVYSGMAEINYPTGFTKDNCTVIGIMGYNSSHTDYWSSPMPSSSTTSALLGNGDLMVTMTPTVIRVRSDKNDTSMPRKDISFKLTLMKIEPDVSDYELGDVNMDGEIVQADYDLVNAFLQGTGTLTDKQFKLADMNEDGKIDSMDTYLLIQKINENT